MLQDQLLVAALRPGHEVDHRRLAAESTGLHRAIHRRPPGLGEVRGLGADDRIRVALHTGGRRFRLHVFGVVLHLTAPHAVADDVEERQHPHRGTVDDLRLKLREIPPAGAAGVDHRGCAVGQGVLVRLQPAGESPKGMDVDVYQPRRDEPAVDVDAIARRMGRKVLFYRCDPTVLRRHIADAVDPVGGIDDPAAAENEIVLHSFHTRIPSRSGWARTERRPAYTGCASAGSARARAAS